ncbi:Uncharacterized protein ChrSV_4417 [Chromobacterium vaccinii]|nr:Uncharacterized protein ChrSW_4417 [Chromobacterium vaccinii]QND91873.1 Uncharacterized protein ChrSV_4417 [Chromobacterium vaccinii]
MTNRGGLNFSTSSQSGNWKASRGEPCSESRIRCLTCTDRL